jgi:hypothetical protein
VKQIRKRLTYANVMSSIAMFLVIGGATAFAATELAKNSVGTKQLKKEAVATAKIKKEAITNAKIKKGTIEGASLNLSSIGTVPSATKAETANKATSATTAETANKANSATTAETANKANSATTAESAGTAANANALGGQPPSAYQPRTQWAFVKSNGTIVQQSGGITLLSQNVNGGNYIDFGQSIVGKSIITSPRYLDPNAGSNSSHAAAEPCAGPLNTFPCLFGGTFNNPNVAFVLTSDFEGNGEPFGFSILVTP